MEEVVKPRVKLADFQAAQAAADIAWMEAFEKIKTMGEHAALADGWKVAMIGGDPHPAWVWVKRKKEEKMVRRGDVFIHDLIRLSANSNEHFHREKA